MASQQNLKQGVYTVLGKAGKDRVRARRDGSAGGAATELGPLPSGIDVAVGAKIRIAADGTITNIE